jgi:hypothetical protein
MTQNMNPTVFIGTSSESGNIAHAIKDQLGSEIDVFVWDENLFKLGDDTLSSLLKFVSIYDFSVFILSDDDLVESRRLRYAAPRDNTILELGFFMGAAGRRRAFPVIVPSKKNKTKIPSDLLGNTELRLPSNFRELTLIEGVKDAAESLKQTILERQSESQLQLLPSTGLAVGYYLNFIKPVCDALSDMDSIEINGERFDIRKDEYALNIVLPYTLSDASSAGASRYVKDQELDKITIKTKSRDRPIYAQTGTQDGRIQLFDYPTTLSASHRAIDLLLPSGFIGKTKVHFELEDKEIRNFQKTINHLLLEPEAAEFRERIHFFRLEA